jgi:hypothetical protein
MEQDDINCDVCCDPITKYDIREGQDIIPGEVDIERLPSIVPPMLGDDLEDTDDPFEILNPTPDKLLARELGRKRTALDEEIIVTPQQTSMVLNYSSGELFNRFDNLIDQLNRLRAINFTQKFEQNLLKRLSEITARLASNNRMDPASIEGNIIKILASDIPTKRIINEIFDARLPLIIIDTNIQLQDALEKVNFTNLLAVATAMQVSDGFSQNFPSVSAAADSSKNQFSNPLDKLGQIISLLQTVIGILNSLNQLMSSSNFQSATSENRNSNVSMLQKLPDLLQNFQNFNSQIGEVVGQLKGMLLNPKKLNEIINLQNDILGKTNFIQHIAKEITGINDITKLAESTNLFKDVSSMLEKSIFGKSSNEVQNLMQEMQQKLTEAQSSLPTEADKKEIIDSRIHVPGKVLGKFLSALALGQAIPSQLQANNPLLSLPSYAGKAFFGEALNAMPAMDQLFAKKIAMFTNSEGGAGKSAFDFLNLPTGDGASLQNLVPKLLNIPNEILGNSGVQSVLGQVANDVGNILGADINTLVQLNKADNAIPIMIAFASRISGDTSSPFPTDVFSKGWKAANLARGVIEKVNPGLFNDIYDTVKNAAAPLLPPPT